MEGESIVDRIRRELRENRAWRITVEKIGEPEEAQLLALEDALEAALDDEMAAIQKRQSVEGEYRSLLKRIRAKDAER